MSGPFERTHGVATANAGGRHVVSPSDELFFLLEGHVVSGRSGTWRVEVCGVYSTDTDRWVQLNLAGPCRCGVTLRAGFREPSAIVDLLVDWLDDTLPSELETCVVSQASRDPSWMCTDAGTLPTYMM